MRARGYIQSWCPLIFLALNTVQIVANSLQEECRSEFKTPVDPSPHACVCDDSEPDSSKKNLCSSSSSEAILRSFDLYVKKNSEDMCLAGGSFGKLTAEMLDSLCYLKRHEVLKDLLPLLKNLVSGTGKLSSNESSSIADLLPDGSCIYPQFKCIEDTNNKIVSVCGGSSYGGDSTHIKFEMDAYSNTATCTCKIKSDVSSIKIRAVDVRLENDASLQLKGDRENRYLFDPYKIYWLQDGDLLQHNKEVIVELSKLDSSNLPVNMWLQIDGSKLNVTCAGRNMGITDVPDAGSSDSASVLEAGPVAGIVLAVIFVIIVIAVLVVLWSRQKERSKFGRKGADHSLDVQQHDVHHYRNVQLSAESGLPPLSQSNPSLQQPPLRPQNTTYVSQATRAMEPQAAAPFTGFPDLDLVTIEANRQQEPDGNSRPLVPDQDYIEPADPPSHYIELQDISPSNNPKPMKKQLHTTKPQIERTSNLSTSKPEHAPSHVTEPLLAPFSDYIEPAEPPSEYFLDLQSSPHYSQLSGQNDPPADYAEYTYPAIYTEPTDGQTSDSSCNIL